MCYLSPPIAIDDAFWIERIRIAYELRKTLRLAGVENNNTFRLIHGEGDNLPGLVIDMYAHTAVMQAHSVGMHYARHQIAEALKAVLGDTLQNIYYKSEATLPYKANLGSEDGYLFGGEVEDIAIENGLKILCRLAERPKDRFLRGSTGESLFVGALRKGSLRIEYVLLYGRFLFLCDERRR